MATASSRLCMVALVRPNSTTGQTSFRNRASLVPPLVDSSGVTPVSASIASASSAEKRPGLVRKASPEITGRALPPCFSAMAAIRSASPAPLCRSLNRTERRADAREGMTLVAGLPTVTSVTSRLLGWNHLLPLSSFIAFSSPSIATSRVIGLSARCG